MHAGFYVAVEQIVGEKKKRKNKKKEASGDVHVKKKKTVSNTF